MGFVIIAVTSLNFLINLIPIFIDVIKRTKLALKSCKYRCKTGKKAQPIQIEQVSDLKKLDLPEDPQLEAEAKVNVDLPYPVEEEKVA